MIIAHLVIIIIAIIVTKTILIAKEVFNKVNILDLIIMMVIIDSITILTICFVK